MKDPYQVELERLMVARRDGVIIHRADADNAQGNIGDIREDGVVLTQVLGVNEIFIAYRDIRGIKSASR